jgi:cold shock CspA family protein
LASRGNKESADDFIADKNRELAARLTERRRRSDPIHLDRVLGSVENLVENGGYGFINSEGKQFFFHASALWDRRFFDELRKGSRVAFAPGAKVSGKTTPAMDVYWVA